MEAKGSGAKDYSLRCPRCRARSPVSAGKCTACGLPMYTNRLRQRLGPDDPRPPHFLSGRFHRTRKDNAPPRPRASREEFAGVNIEAPPSTDLLPKRHWKEGQAPQASGKTTMYQVGELRPPPNPPVLSPDELPTDVLPQPKPNGMPVKPKPKAKSKLDELLVRDDEDDKVEVGGMAEFLMHPSERTEQYSDSAVAKTAASGPRLELGARRNEQEGGFKRTAGGPGARQDDPLESSGLDLVSNEPIAPPESAPNPILDRPPEPQEIYRPPAPRPGEEEYLPWRFVAKWVAPQALVLLLLLLLGPSYIHGHYVLEGDYQAVFTDADGRRVACATVFRSDADARFALHGTLDCQLYPNKISIERIDEPRVLKLIMGNGKIPYAGHFDFRGLELTLGVVNEELNRSATLRARFSPNVRHIVGTVTDSQGLTASVTLDPAPAMVE